MWQRRPAILALRKWRQEDREYKAIPSYIMFVPSLGYVRPYFKKPKTNKTNYMASVWLWSSLALLELK